MLWVKVSCLGYISPLSHLGQRASEFKCVQAGGQTPEGKYPFVWELVLAPCIYQVDFRHLVRFPERNICSTEK